MTGIGRALAAILLASAVAGAAVFAHLLAGGSGTRPSVMGSLPPAPTSPLVVQATVLPESARAPGAPFSPVLPRSGVLHSAFTRRATTPAPGPVADATPTRPLVAQPPVIQPPVIQPPVAQAPAAEPTAPAPVAAPAPPDRGLAATSPAVGAPAKHGDAKHGDTKHGDAKQADAKQADAKHDHAGGGGGGDQDDQHHTGSDSPPAVLASVTPDAAPTAGDDSEDGHPQRGDHDDGG